MTKNPLDLIDALIADLEAKLNLPPGGKVETEQTKKETQQNQAQKKEATAAAEATATATATAAKSKPAAAKGKNNKAPKQKNNNNNKAAAAAADQPDICKLEFKVGQITKVWVHPEADKLYCEEIDVGEDQPRQIASGLRPHFTEDQMLNQRLLVVSNLKPKNLVGFKSHGMVLCAAKPKEDGGEIVEFLEPPPEAPIGEVVTFEGLPTPQPWSASQVDKKKVFATCMEGMRTGDDCVGVWNGHVFTTTAGPCRAKSIAGGVLR